MEDNITQFIDQHHECYDRFTFDMIMRFLLKEGCSHEEAKDLIIFNCSLSAIIFQERIHNGGYMKVSVQEKISEDLREFRNEIRNTKFLNQN